MNIRTSGILLPVFSLPSPFGIGDLGPRALAFADRLQEAGQHVWQILPLNPTVAEYGDSPYHSPSAFAFNPLLISPEWMAEDGFVEQKDLEPVLDSPEDRIDYRAVREAKEKLFDKALDIFRRRSPGGGFLRFCDRNARWLDDYALFTALSRHFETTDWSRWPPEVRDRDPGALRALSCRLAEDVAGIKFLQFLFCVQWRRFKTCCNERHIHLLGDIPIYVPLDSADVWAHPDLFKLDEAKQPVAVSGVPPDYFSDTGQLWGHPVYRWEVHQKRRYEWWFHRIAHNLGLFDYIRIDHFRGLVACWEVPADEKTAVNGKWTPVPAEDFFDALLQRFPCVPVIAEDLGYITADVREIIRRYNFPGMKVLTFGLMGALAKNPNAPHNVGRNSVVYTGTHDTNTVKGWFETELDGADKDQVFRYLGCRLSPEEVPWALIRTALMSPAHMSIVPMQDILALGADARTNRPAAGGGNWRWRLTGAQLASAPMERLQELTRLYGRV